MEGPEGATSSAEGFLSVMALNDNKAGMEGLDRDKINMIILETSKGSRFYENELKKEQQVDQRIERMLQQKAHITEQQMRMAQAQVEKMGADLERGRDLGRVIVHVDMDAFYAAVEMRDCPELKEKPMAVGSMSMLSTSNYQARRFGVRAAMPGFIAKKLCPSLVIVPLNFHKYRAVSVKVREIFADYDPNFLPVSLDEAYLDISEHLEQRRGWPESMRTHPVHTESGEGKGTESQGELDSDGLSPILFEDSPIFSPRPQGMGDIAVFGICAEEAVREMRFRIEQRTTLTASAGIAPNMMLAKVCSDKNKPNGQYRIPAERQAVMDFIQDLPIRKVQGIGKVTEKMLRALGITTCSQLGQKGALLSLLFSEVSWHHFLHISLGLGCTRIKRDGKRKSMSTERTFAEISSVEEQYDLCRELCRDLSQDLQKEGLKGKTVTLKLKNVNFEVKTRGSTLSSVVSSEEEIFAAAKDLLKVEIDNASPHPLRLRLIGVQVSGFVNSDDKKPLQKSIISFLHSGRSQGAALQGAPVPKDAPANRVVPPKPLQLMALEQADASHTVTQDPRTSLAKQEGVPRILSWPKEEGQQSFFEKARTLRLQQQTRQGDPQERGDTLTSAQSEPQPSTSRRPEEFFTCPVCFQEQKSNDLGSFNRHVDECLSGVSTGHCDTDTDGSPETGTGVGDEESCSLDRWMQTKAASALAEVDARTGSKACQKALGKNSIKQPMASGVHTLNGLGLKATGNGNIGTHIHFPFDFVKGNSGKDTNERVADHLGHIIENNTERKAQGRMLGSTSCTMTCPVCNMQQDTSDLALFNRHVDICLNQGVLLEFGGGTVSHNFNVTSGTKVKGKPENAPKPSSKNKRHMSPPHAILRNPKSLAPETPLRSSSGDA
ncbi:hypothetical protein AAFF_G00316420 [Aldrovandia affinis]|uniref:DNA polymerase kappa n=1 Tax=Aldrovandia affinis TaxID=143900 RepID=A0AAD7SMZ6_9TELE|nr:hypothetical protein AAFF_G00316420 [Aldrovandia affinis]